MLKGKIIKNGSNYVAIAPGGAKLNGNFRIREQAVKALVTYNEEKHKEKINYEVNKLEIKMDKIKEYIKDKPKPKAKPRKKTTKRKNK